MQGIAAYLKRQQLTTGTTPKVVVLCGAGISTSAGIPDYRSKGGGIYTADSHGNKVDRKDLFAMFHDDPESFWEKIRLLFGPVRDQTIRPTPCHHFLVDLYRHGMLQRVYTQNIDGLERIAGLPREKLVACHGTVSEVHCAACGAVGNTTAAFSTKNIPICSHGSCRGVIRPSVVFFGEQLPSEFFSHQSEDFDTCTCLIVMGTSLKVYPFASLVNQPSMLVPRLLINREAVGPFRDPDIGAHEFRDVVYLGECDQGCLELKRALGWESL